MRTFAATVIMVAALPIGGTATAQTPANPRMGDPVSQTKLLDWSGEPTAEARALTSEDREELFRAAGIQAVGGGRWTGCVEDPSGNSEAEIAMMQDLNGDGRPEVLIHDHGTFCNGMAGVESIVLTRSSGDRWDIIYSNQGFANFLVSRGTDGFPDIEAGLPGFCFPYFRWDGTEYDVIARLDEEGRACDPG